MKKMELKVSSGFELEKSVCNHGFFMMAPNRWIPSTKTLTRPLRLQSDHHFDVTIFISISQPCSTFLSITILDDLILSPSREQEIVDQMKRMLRLSKEDEKQVKEFHKLHEKAAKLGFGRLFRNPSLFEDVVKSLLLCGCTFQGSLQMVEELCNLDTKVGSRRNWGNFPSEQELANPKLEKLLRKSCNLGYRTGYITCLAKVVTNGQIDLEKFNKQLLGGDHDEELMFKRLKRIKGFGDFVTSNVFMCMGFYHRIPIDSETIRHIKQIHQRENCNMKNVNEMVKEIYGKYAPFQTLAYWLEMVEYYENNLGKLSLLERCHYKRVTGSILSGTCSSNQQDSNPIG